MFTCWLKCRTNTNFECHHCRTAPRMQIVIRFTMDPQRECDFFCMRNDWKAEIIVNPCKTPARMRLLIASETPKKENPLSVQKKYEFWVPPLQNRSENANRHPFYYGSAARMFFFCPAKRLNSRNYRQPLQNPSENAAFDCQRNAWKNQTPFQGRKNTNFK